MKGAPQSVPLFNYDSTDIMSIGAEGGIRTKPSRPDPASIVAETPDHLPLIYPPAPVCIPKYVGKMSAKYPLAALRRQAVFRGPVGVGAPLDSRMTCRWR